MIKSIYFLSFFVLLFTACKDKDKGKDPAPVAPPVAAFYFTATIDGQQISFKEGVDNYLSVIGLSESSVTGGGTNESQNMIMMDYRTANKNTASVTISQNFADRPTCLDVMSMYSVKAYPFGKDETMDDDPIGGAIIEYVDAAGKQWRSSAGTAIQTGSNFKITEHVAKQDVYAKYITTSTFNCILYDGLGNSKVLTNGAMKSRSVLCP